MILQSGAASADYHGAKPSGSNAIVQCAAVARAFWRRKKRSSDACGGCGPSAAALIRQVVDLVSLDAISPVGVDVVRIIWFYGSVSAVPPRRPSGFAR